MLARLFVVLLLAFSLVGWRGVTPVEAASSIEIIQVADTEAGLAGSELTSACAPALRDPLPRQLVLLPPTAEGSRSAPDLGRVFRPPRSPGSSNRFSRTKLQRCEVPCPLSSYRSGPGPCSASSY